MDTADLQTVLTRLFVAVLLSGLLGLERERRGRAAGLRTHILVCLGSTVAMIISEYFARALQASGSPVWMDQGRVAAGIITGIGFLGAGTIMTHAGAPRGLTTAAMVWFAAILGVGVGAGYLTLSAIATAFALASTYGLERLENFIPSHERMAVKMRMKGDMSQADAVENYFTAHGFHVLQHQSHVGKEGNLIQVSYELGCRQRPRISAFVNDVCSAVPAIQEIEVDY
ncbi:MAG: hypothetical protein AMXMBFR84_18360 [Candidatus Hydrogenedentota bacterium]